MDAAPKPKRLVGGAIVVALCAAIGLALSSARVRGSLSAAYRAFKNPTGNPAPPAGSAREEPSPPAIDLEQPDVAGDFDPAAGLTDAGAAALVTPDIPVPVTQKTMRFVQYFASDPKGREAFVDRFKRSGRYRAYVGHELRDAGLPEDLAWMPAILSGWNPQAVSPEGATGLFQFMPKTAARFGLAQSDFIDDRRSITRSTAAAATLLHELYDRYQAWDLALAAYNYGADPLDEAIAKLKSKRAPREAEKPVELKDLADAHLVPKVTANFIPEVQAFAIVAANRGRFGLDGVEPLEAFDFGEIAVPPGTELKTIAHAAGLTIDVVRDYNPNLLKPSVPPSGDTIVEVPADRVSRTLAAFPSLAERAAQSADAGAKVASNDATTTSPSPAAKPAAAPAPAIDPAADRWTLSNGVAVELKGTATAEVRVSTRIELLAPTRTGTKASGPVIQVDAIADKDVDAALGRAAAAARKTIETDARAQLRKLAFAARRDDVEKKPYGASWNALSDKLFVADQPLAGAVLAAPILPLTSVVIANDAPVGALRVTVTIEGADRERAQRGSSAFAKVLEAGADAPAYPREDRLSMRAAVQSPNVVFAWIGPPDDDANGAALRLAVLLLAHDRFGKVAHALVSESHAAVHVRGSLEFFGQGSAIAIEAVPGVKHDVAEIGRELDKAIDACVASGPTAQELEASKEQLRARLQSEKEHAGANGEPKDQALARIARVRDRAEAVTVDDTTALVKKVFSRAHRVVVTTEKSD